MNSIMDNIASAVREFRRAYLSRLFSVALAGWLLLTTGVNTTGVNAAPTSQELGRAVRQRVEQTDQTDRPKTTGQFLDEARGDVPLDQRLGNITRDSVEAFKKLGEEYTPDVGQAARDLRDAAANQGIAQ